MKNQRRNGKARKWLSLFIAAAILTCPIAASASTMEEMEQRRNELQAENDQLQAQMDALRNDEASAQEYQQALSDKIDNLEVRIDTARANIETLNTSIAALEVKLEQYRKDNETVIAMFKERVKVLYTAGSFSTMEVLLDSSSFSDFSMRSELLQAVNKHDKELVAKLQKYMDDTKTEREELQAEEAALAEIKKGLEADQSELQGLEEENAQLISELQVQQSEKAETIAANEEEDATLNANIQALIEERNRQEQLAREEEERRRQELEASGGSTGSGGGSITVTPTNPGMSSGFSPMWPLPGYGTEWITGHFGDMYSNGPHNGLDIGVPYGTPIVAAQAGQVLSAEYHYSWGNNVLVWHNDSYSTRYAHMSSMAVSPGQYVEQGQVIGYVGSTGNSTGNHLHFEVYLGGTRVNPDPYLFG